MGNQPPSTPPPPPPADGPTDKRQAKAQAKADKAYAKASRPWFKKKRIIIPGVLVLLIVVIALGSGDTSTDNPSARTSSSGGEAADPTDESALYPDRVDRQGKDIEAPVGETVSVGGYSATVTSLEFVQELNDFEDEGYMVAEIEITNDSDRSRPYNTFDWRIQTPNGQVLDPGMHDNIGSGDLVTGGNVSGQVVFDVGSDISGEYYIIFKPSAWDAARGIWGKTF